MAAESWTEEIPLENDGRLYVYRNDTDLGGGIFGLDLTADQYTWPALKIHQPTLITVQMGRRQSVAGGTNPEFNFIHWPLGAAETRQGGGDWASELYADMNEAGTPARAWVPGGNSEQALISRGSARDLGLLSKIIHFGEVQLQWNYDVAPTGGAVDRIVMATIPWR